MKITNTLCIYFSAAIATAELDIKAAPTAGCTVPLPFGGSIVATQVPFFVSFRWWGKATKTHHTLEPLPPPTHALTLLPVCDASGTEVLPTNCISHTADSSPGALAKRDIPDNVSTVYYRDDESELGDLDAGSTSAEEGMGGWPEFQYPENNVAGLSSSVPRDGYSKQNECVDGAMQCTHAGRGFDTCVYGKWGTIRKCPLGTRCTPVRDDSIICASGSAQEKEASYVISHYV
ncbi:hypothetical protein GGH99_000421 [Coemansia sp. RSA 1285]|nr:hypothetical protein GGH99_000421 [Coemansia sp. RSA 1285]